jgi:hypothetical protein
MMDYGMKPASVQKRKMATVARGNRKAMAPAKAAQNMKRLSGLSKVQAKEIASRIPKKMATPMVKPVKRKKMK